jgi:hypothetical protein
VSEGEKQPRDDWWHCLRCGRKGRTPHHDCEQPGRRWLCNEPGCWPCRRIKLQRARRDNGAPL